MRVSTRVSSTPTSRVVLPYRRKPPEEARRVAGTLLPDMVRSAPARPVFYPDNGRLLTDDVGDLNVAIFTTGRVTEDGVGPHNDLQPEFPYLGPPHEDRT